MPARSERGCRRARALSLFVVEFDEGGGDLLEAELAGRLEDVVSRPHLASPAVDHDRAALAVGARLSLTASRSPRWGLRGWGRSDEGPVRQRFPRTRELRRESS